MYKKLLLLSVLLLFACSSNDGNNDDIDYLGTYRGDIQVSINDTYHSTLYNHSMTFVSVGNSSEVTIIGNLIITTTCDFDQNGFIISQTTSVSNDVFYALEYGSGTLNGDTLQIELHQDQINNSTNEVQATGTWTGSLTKIN